MASFQIEQQLDPKDKRVKGINEAYQTIRNLLFLADFHEKYQIAFHLEICRKNEKNFI